MKKATLFVAAILMAVAFATTTFAGPIDWVAEKAGYVPVTKYEIAKAETSAANALAVNALAEATKAAKAAEAAKEKADETTYTSIVGAAMVLLIGGIAFWRRTQLAEFILEHEKKKSSPDLTV